MRVIEMGRGGGPEVLEIGMRNVPHPAAGEVLIKVKAAGVNGPDLWQRRGQYPPPDGASDLLGLEVAGDVVMVGEGVTRWNVGDQATALTNGGGYAEYCVVDEQHCLAIPDGLTVVEAASLPETFFTVWSNLFMDATLREGETLLVHGGAGGIGATAIQLGKAHGVKVFATDSPEERCEFCRLAGADRVIDYRTEDFVQIVREAGGAHVILDIVGGPNIERNFKAAVAGGRIVQLAFGLGSKVEINLMPVMLKRLIYTGSTLRTRSSEFKATVARQLEVSVWPLIEAGRIKTRVTALPLADAAKAHVLMESATHVGKLVLIP